MIYRIYQWSLLIKAVNALSEVAAGLAVYLLSKAFIVNYILNLVMGGLSDDPSDKIGLFIVNSISDFSISSKLFLSVYLLLHGVLKLFAIFALWSKKLWAYPVSLTVFIALIAYQLHRYYLTGSIWLVVMSAFDLFLVVLIWHEYRLARRQKNI